MKNHSLLWGVLVSLIPLMSGAGDALAATKTTKQSAIQKGTSVRTKVAATGLYDQECYDAFYGCMDQFCITDNANGGSCACSDKSIEYEKQFAEIQKKLTEAERVATVEVEKVKAGADADIIFTGQRKYDANGNVLSVDELSKEDTKTKKRADLLAMFETSYEEDIFEDNTETSIADLSGDALKNAAEELCLAQVPESCSGDMTLLRQMYSRQIVSDCKAFENVIASKTAEADLAMANAESDVRAALKESFESANKYDLGQCTVQFKKCMQTTAGCGEDFSGCAAVAAMDETNVRKSTTRAAKPYQIKGAATTIEISASTYDTLMAKKPLCETVTKSCVNVASQVWDTFLREVAPQVKSAEIIAEDKARQDCVGNIASCFQKACKDTIDPNDPDGSYDICLTRPGTMLNLCKVPLNACGIDTSSVQKAQESQIWDFVMARMAAMRVDACTNEVKSCLQADDRCGKDYANCIGLDLPSIKKMCPLDKLVACQAKDENGNFATSWNNIDSMIYGIMLNLDNSMLDQCQRIVNDKVIEICGDLDECHAFDNDPYMGTDSLVSYADSNGDYVIEGLVSFGNVRISEITLSEKDKKEGKVQLGKYSIDIGDYESHLGSQDATVTRVIDAIRSVENKIGQKIAVLTQDEKVRRCIDGRDMSQITGAAERGTARFPHLLDSHIMNIMSSGLDRANKNYTKKYEELLAKALEEKDDAVKSVLCAAMATNTEPQCTTWSAQSDGTAICTTYSANTLADVFEGTNKQGLVSGQDTYATKYVIAGAKIADLAKVQQKGHSEHTMLDKDGNMMGKIVMNAMYSADKNTCMFTTSTTLCKETEAVITTDTRDYMDQSSGGLVGGGGCSGQGGVFTISNCEKESTTTQSYQGSPCKEYGEPQTVTQSIKM